MPYQNPYYPQFQPAYQFQQPIHGFVYVAGIEGAKAYQMPPNSEMPLFDSTTEDVMFIKTTDAAGYPTIKPVRCVEIEETSDEPATRDDLNRMYSDLAAQVEQLKGAIHGLVSTSTGPANPGNVADAGGNGEPTSRGDAAYAERQQVR